MPYTRILREIDQRICVENYQPQKLVFDFSILFVHGNFCGSWCFKNFLSYFASAGIPCYALNLRGHWLSQQHADLGKSTVDDYIQDVQTVLSHIETATVAIGHSMGGVLCQKVAQRQNLRGLILLDSAPNKEITTHVLQPKSEVNQLLQELVLFEPDGTCSLKKDPQGISKVFFEAGRVSKEALSQTVAYLGRESAQVLKEHAFLSVDAKQVTCPVSVIGRKGHGVQSSPDLWNAIADYFNATNRYIRDDMGHGMLLQDNWQEYAQIMRSWL